MAQLENQTFKLRRPFGHTLLLTILCFILLFSITELLLRLEPIAARLPSTNFGGRHKQLDRQFARLDWVVSREGKIDCFLLGDSLVWLGLDPEVFQTKYKDVTGESLHCFNFGVSALPTAAAAELADYLAKTYHPRLLIYGVHARDLSVPITDEDSVIVRNNPWLQYRQGNITLLSWLYAHLTLLRNLDYIRAMMQVDTYTAKSLLGWEYRQLHGFDPKSVTLLDVEVPPDVTDPRQQEGFRWYWDYGIQKENVLGLEHIAELNNEVQDVLIVVMPVHANLMGFFRNGKQDYARFVTKVEETVTPTGTPVWILNGQVKLPDDGWFDYSHLNLKGAGVLSDWLGTQVGNAVNGVSTPARDAFAPHH